MLFGSYLEQILLRSEVVVDDKIGGANTVTYIFFQANGGQRDDIENNKKE